MHLTRGVARLQAKWDFSIRDADTAEPATSERRSSTGHLVPAAAAHPMMLTALPDRQAALSCEVLQWRTVLNYGGG